MDLTPFTPARIRRYAAPLAIQSAYVSPYARAAAVAYQNRATVGKAAKFLLRNRTSLWRLANKRRREQMGLSSGRASRVGDTPGVGVAKKDQISTSLTESWSSRAITYYDLTDVKKTRINIADNLANADLEINKINRRQRQVINIRGFLINQSFTNNVNAPMVINVAVIAPRNSNSDVASGDGFFRDFNESRDVNFSTGLSGLQLTNLPISTDKWHVLHRQKFMLGPKQVDAVGDFNTRVPANYRIIRKYIKFNRQIRYNDDTGTTAEQKVFLVWWADTLQAAPGTTPTGFAYNTQTLAVTYFSESMTPY